MFGQDDRIFLPKIFVLHAVSDVRLRNPKLFRETFLIIPRSIHLDRDFFAAESLSEFRCEMCDGIYQHSFNFSILNGDIPFIQVIGYSSTGGSAFENFEDLIEMAGFLFSVQDSLIDQLSRILNAGGLELWSHRSVRDVAV